jgi:hypothetical protein
MPKYDPANPPKWAGFPRRLAYLLFGVALGFMILGFYQQAKRNQEARDEELRQFMLKHPQPEDKLFPPIPRATDQNPTPVQAAPTKPASDPAPAQTPK